MSAGQRRRGKSLHLDLPGAEGLPPLSALFLIQFDVKAGYTIAWKRAKADLELDDSVEFKSLPSGLHNVTEDLIYFMHGDDHAGISAFVNTSNEQWERKALMLAVGALLPLEQGRLGRSWKHASKLQELAKEIASDPSNTKALEDYWETNQLADGPDVPGTPETVKKVSVDPQGSPRTTDEQPKRRPRMKSISSLRDAPGVGLSPHHPAISLPTLIETFGPLIYPLYKAAILRKRILFVNEAPVELACNFVYDVSIISNIPSSVCNLIPLEPLPSRLQPLFAVGVHDIDDLARRARVGASQDDGRAPMDPGYGWIACTSDDVLGMKTDLYDVLIKLPPYRATKAKDKAWPVMKTAAGQDIKATQRDLRRYRTLRQSQKRASPSSDASSMHRRRTDETAVDEDGDDDNDNETRSLLPRNMNETFDDSSSAINEKLVEPLSWSALAYNSFMWWASAGEKRSDMDEEMERDAAMFRDFNSYADTPSDSGPRRRLSSGTGNVMTPGFAMIAEGAPAVPEMAIIAYFHRLTASIVSTLAELVDAADASEEEAAAVIGAGQQQEGGNGNGDGDSDGDAQQQQQQQQRWEVKDRDAKSAIFVSSEDMTRMGLDVWSEGDRLFVVELLEFYWGRRADVQGGRIECCGVRIL